ncbi:pseudouridine synthase, partial [Anaerolineae bacterium CFX9]|nr:pseudouridine synthase [Anaerolineae bacterium CFX9]
MKERLQKILATANYGSRRACEELIEQGRVRVNGAIAGLGDKADPAVDVIEVDGERLRPNRTEKVYFALNKPKNVLSTSLPHRSDERRTVFSYVPFDGRLHLIGRLDADSDGLVVLTNDGELAQKLTHPSFRHTKTYRVQITGLPTPDSLRKWREGMYIDEDGEMVKTAPCSVEIVEAGTRQTILRIMMVEGRKRQIRRMANTLGHRVLKLTRTHIGLLPLDPLREGEWRRLTPDELTLLSTPDSEYDEIMKMRSEQKRIERERKETQQRRRSERYAQEAPERPRRSTAGRPSRQSDSPRPASRRTSAGGRGYDDDRGYPAERSSKPRWERDDRPSAGDRDSRPRR